MLGHLFMSAAFATAAPVVDVEYLLHSGWIVRTPAHVLVFDYVERLPSGVELDDSLRVDAGTFDDRRIVVFVSHGHIDHFDQAVVEWRRQRPDIEYFVGSPDVNVPGARVMGPRETWSSADIVVKTTHSTDEGVGFLVAVDDVVVYHAGDHAQWTEHLTRAFLAEIRWLKRVAPRIDIAFFPIATGAACEATEVIRDGVIAAARYLEPRVLVPMHVGCPDRLAQYAQFEEVASPVLPSTQVVAPLRAGDRFVFDGGRLRRFPLLPRCSCWAIRCAGVGDPISWLAPMASWPWCVQSRPSGFSRTPCVSLRWHWSMVHTSQS